MSAVTLAFICALVAAVLAAFGERTLAAACAVVALIVVLVALLEPGARI